MSAYVEIAGVEFPPFMDDIWLGADTRVLTLIPHDRVGSMVIAETADGASYALTRAVGNLVVVNYLAASVRTGRIAIDSDRLPLYLDAEQGGFVQLSTVPKNCRHGAPYGKISVFPMTDYLAIRPGGEDVEIFGADTDEYVLTSV